MNQTGVRLTGQAAGGADEVGVGGRSRLDRVGGGSHDRPILPDAPDVPSRSAVRAARGRHACGASGAVC